MSGEYLAVPAEKSAEDCDVSAWSVDSAGAWAYEVLVYSGGALGPGD